MSSVILWLIGTELIILIIVIIIKFIQHKIENKKIKYVLNFLETRINKKHEENDTEKLKECLKVINQYKGEVRNE